MRQNPLFRIVPYLRPFRLALTLMVLGALGAQVVMAFVPLLIQKVIDDAIGGRSQNDLWLLVGLLAVAGLLEGLLLFMRRYTLARASSLMESHLRRDLYSHLQRLSLDFHNEWQSGQLLSRAMSDTNVIFRGFVSFSAVFFVANIATIGVVFVLLLRINVPLALLVSVSAFPIGWFAIRFQDQFRLASRRRQDSEGDLATYVEEAALGIRVTTTFGRTDVTDARFKGLAENTRHVAVEAAVIKARFDAVLSLISDLAMAAVLGAGAWAVSTGALSVGGLVAFLSLLLMLLWPVKSMGEILAITHEASSASERIFEVFDSTPDIRDEHGASALDAVETTGVSLRSVDYSYGSGGLVLDGLDLEVRAGETLAVVGRTGSGKTTLCALIPRLVDAGAGEVVVAGRDVRTVTLESLRSVVSVAFEDALLFSASVRENLLLGHESATEEDIAEAIRVSHSTFVYDLTEGLDTRIGEQGITLSGGQRQRLALARAIVARPSVLVLDDPLSALDVNTEASVHTALAEALTTTTTIITAHRPSTVALADRVAFLDRGRIAAIGKHSELLANVPAYREVLGRGAEELV